MLKRLMVVAAAAVVLFSFLGCDTNSEQQRSVLTVTSVNCNAPAYSDVQDASGGFTDTFIPVDIYNRPYNSLVTTDPASPHGQFVVTSYRVAWQSLDGQAVLPDRVEYTGFEIPTGFSTTAWVRLVTISEKESAILQPLYAGGSRPMRAVITFYGHEAGTERDGDVTANATVTFANYIDGTADNCGN